MAAWCTGKFVGFYCHAVVFSNICVGTKCGIMRCEARVVMMAHNAMTASARIL